MLSYTRSDIKFYKGVSMDNKSNYYYPQDVFDKKFNQCSCKNVNNANAKMANEQQNSHFNDLNIYPNNYIQQDNSSGQQNYNYQQQSQGENQNGQNNFYAQNNDWPQQTNQQIYPQNHNQQKQKNMFGSLNPEQLMSLLSSKGNLSGILGSLGQSNPQLGMLVSLMQNMPKAKKQSKIDETKNVSSESENKERKFVKVKDYYKENQDE